MITKACREYYFDENITNLHWYNVHTTPYKDIKFIKWVYQIDGIVYPFCTEEFKKAYFWEQLKDD